MKRVFYILIIFTFAIVPCGCKKTESGNNPSGFEDFNPDLQQGGTIEAYILRPDTLNPLTTKIDINRRILALCYDSLFYVDSDFKTNPRLAKSYTVSDEGKKITLKLRDDVTWHDGSAFTAADVVYTINTIVKTEGSFYCSFVSDLIDTVRTVDIHTVDIRLNYANSGAVSLLTFPIIKNASATDNSYVIVGTGAFKPKNSVSESVLVLEKNKDWKCGKAYADSINLNILPDEDSVYSAFSTGVVDFVQITKENAGKFSVSDDISYLPLYTTLYNFIGVNCDNELLARYEVRAALSNAIDREAFTTAVYSDYGEPTDLPIHPKAYFYQTPSNTENSANIKKENGQLYLYNQGDNSSVPLKFTLLINEENVTKCTAADHLASMLSEIGIKTTVIKTDFETYSQRINEGDFELYLGLSRISCDANLLPFAASDGNLNNGGFSDQSFEKLLGSALSCENTDKRINLLNDVQKNFYLKLPHIPLCFENEMLVYNSTKLGNAHQVLADNISALITLCCVNR